MNRRDFLKVGGVLSTAVLVSYGPAGGLAGLPVEARIGNTLFRGTSDGKVYVSGNAGRTWELHTNFGPEVSVFSLTSGLFGSLQAGLGFGVHSFELVLAQNGKNWKTV